MADEALFIGWGDVVRGRESKALEVFNESLQFYGRLQQEGTIESVEAWFLGPHGLVTQFALAGPRHPAIHHALLSFLLAWHLSD